MASYAYRDASRTDTILAVCVEMGRETAEEGKTFFCPNPMCDAKLTYHKANGIGHKPYFCALPANGHSKGCIFSAADMYSPSKFKENNFNLETLIKQISNEDEPNEARHGSGGGVTSNKVRECSLSTLKGTYHMCIFYHWSERINNVRICDMLFDKRSAEMYKTGVSGYRMIECIRPHFFYDLRSGTITLKNHATGRAFEFVLSIEGNKKVDLFWKIEKILYNIPENSTVIVAGKWSRVSENKFTAKITNIKQVYVPMH